MKPRIKLIPLYIRKGNKYCLDRWRIADDQHTDPVDEECYFTLPDNFRLGKFEDDIEYCDEDGVFEAWLLTDKGKPYLHSPAEEKGDEFILKRSRSQRPKQK